MRYGTLTNEQLLVIGVAFIVPLVWALKHHGRARMITLMLWTPLWLFVARVVYMNRFPDAPVEMRLRMALRDLGTDPLTTAWPIFVLLIYGLIWLFTIPRRRRKANAQASQQFLNSEMPATVPAPSARPSQTLPPLWREEKPTVPEPLKRCLGCNRRVPIPATSCPHCRYSFAKTPTQPIQPELTASTAGLIEASNAENSEPPRKGQPTLSGVKPLPKLVEQIRLLGELRDDGLLTEEEFQTKKKELLSRI